MSTIKLILTKEEVGDAIAEYVTKHYSLTMLSGRLSIDPVKAVLEVTKPKPIKEEN